MNLFIGTSSKNVVKEKYQEKCFPLLDSLSKMKDVHLVFGDDSNGLMGLCYDMFQKEGKRITGITTKFYEKNSPNLKYDKKIVEDTSMQRMASIYKNSDVFLFLPGGVGTYSEILNCLEESKTSDDEKVIILYNVDFFFRPFLEEMYHLYQEGFLDQNLGDLILISNDTKEIIEKIKECVIHE